MIEQGATIGQHTEALSQLAIDCSSLEAKSSEHAASVIQLEKKSSEHAASVIQLEKKSSEHSDEIADIKQQVVCTRI